MQTPGKAVAYPGRDGLRLPVTCHACRLRARHRPQKRQKRKDNPNRSALSYAEILSCVLDATSANFDEP